MYVYTFNKFHDGRSVLNDSCFFTKISFIIINIIPTLYILNFSCSIVA